MNNFTLEIGTEELPARFLNSVEKELTSRFSEKLKEENFSFENIVSFSTPRRSILHIYGLAQFQPKSEETVLGPAVGIAYDTDNNLTKAGLGFIKSQNATAETVFRVKNEKGEYIAVQKQLGGKSSTELLAEICPIIISSLPFPKKMRWGSSSFAYARPMHWILALLNSNLIEFSVGGISSSNKTFGHRIHGIGPFTIEHADDLEKTLLEKSQIVCDGQKRREMIIAEGNKLAKSFNAEILWKDSLLNEVQGLVENPVPLIGSFDQDFLELPKEVLLTSMEHHQKCFGLADHNKNLLPNFLTVLNVEPIDREVVQKGWEKVLKARLEDARFYWKEDLKDGFSSWIERLDKVIFLGPLGSMGDKSRRIAELCAWLAEKLQIKSEEGKNAVELAKQIGLYSKADLMSKMVGEFDTLQGIMGGIYANKAGFSTEFARAIEEQYLPSGPDSPLPSTSFGACLSLADKADTLVGCFGLGNIPTGTADPYALRRASLGIARILIHFGYNIELSELFEKAYSLYSPNIKWKFSKEESLIKLQEFCASRLKNLFVSNGSETLVAESIISAKDLSGQSLANFVWSSAKRLEALETAIKQDDFIQNAQTIKRIYNIIGKNKITSDGVINPTLFESNYELELSKALELFVNNFDKSYAQNNFTALMGYVTTLRPYIDTFFENVMVMADDQKIKTNRINMLFAINFRIQKLADFSLLQI